MNNYQNVSPPTLSELRKKYRDEYLKSKKEEKEEKDKKKKHVDLLRQSNATNLKLMNEFMP